MSEYQPPFHMADSVVFVELMLEIIRDTLNGYNGCWSVNRSRQRPSDRPTDCLLC